MSDSRGKNTRYIQRPRMTTIKITISVDKNLLNCLSNSGGKLKCPEFSQQHSEGNDLFLEQHMLLRKKVDVLYMLLGK